jgi:hypothetical protein
LLFLAATFLVFTGCQKDGNDGADSPFLMSRSADNGMIMTYDLTTTRTLRPVNPDDESRLTHSERSLMVPEVTAMRVHFELDKEGNYFYKIDVLPSPVEYPQDMIGRNYVTTTENIGRMEFKNSGSKYYDKAGKLLDEIPPSSADDLLIYKEMAENLSERVILPQDQFEIFMQAWEEAGYEVEHNGENLYSIKFELSGGRTTYVFVDKAAQNIVGTTNYEADGSLVNRTHNITTGDPINPEKIVSVFTTPFTVPLSETDMVIMVTSKATNIVKTLNL